MQDYAEEEEICTLQVTELKEAEKRLQVEGELLERRKLLHIRELKRSRDERASQYQLICLSALACMTQIYLQNYLQNCAQY